MRQSFFFLLMLAALGGPPAFAESEPTTLESCRSSLSSMAYKQCIGELLEMEEQHLAVVLAKAREDFNSDEAKAAFNEAQNAWASFQANECAAAFERIAPGSDASGAQTRCRIVLINERIRHLKEEY